jgi:hypothetical protein
LTLHTAQDQLRFECAAGFTVVDVGARFVYECFSEAGTGRFAGFEGWLNWDLDDPAQPDRLVGLITVPKMGGQTFELEVLGTGSLAPIEDSACESGRATLRRLTTTFQHLGRVNVEAVRCEPLEVP